jgi:hypothetical protein
VCAHALKEVFKALPGPLVVKVCVPLWCCLLAVLGAQLYAGGGEDEGCRAGAAATTAVCR